jgi:predicted dehydrogenase
VFFPAAVPKRAGALRFGILGAANIAPLALITPAQSHEDVVVLAVAARNRAKAEEYAKKHGIPKVHGSYQGVWAIGRDYVTALMCACRPA